MIRLLASTSADGVSPETTLLRSLLRRADVATELTITHDDARRWPAGALPLFEKLGVLKSIEPASHVVCDGCCDGGLLQIELRECNDHVFGLARCPSCGPVRIAMDRLQQWRLDFVGVAACVAKTLRLQAGLAIEIPDRIICVGSYREGDFASDLFIAKGLAKPDAWSVLEQSPRLRASAVPSILTFAVMPPRRQGLALQPGMLSLAECSAIRCGKLEVDLQPLTSQRVTPHPASDAPAWLTVTEAGEMLLDVVSGLDLPRARGRVSAAASDRKFRTNGDKGRNRRIDLHSFNTWLMQQRQRELDHFDQNDW